MKITETVSEGVELIKEVVLGGIQLYLDSPAKLKLRIDEGYETRREHDRKQIMARSHIPEKLIHKPLVPASSLKLIDLQFWDDYYNNWFEARIGINIDQRTIDYGSTSSMLLGNQHHGSGAIAIAIFSLPVIFILWPFLKLKKIGYEKREREMNISRHGQALLKALAGQLDDETLKLLTDALMNDWNHRVKMNREVTFVEAKELLGKCKMEELSISSNDCRQFRWFDDEGDQVAFGDFRSPEEHKVQVLGSEFEGEDADALIDVYRTKESQIEN